MKINQIIINETTTAGAVATVAKPMGETQKRPEVKGLHPVGSKMKKKGPYANSLNESKMKELSMDLSAGKDGLNDADFKKKYGKSKEEMRKSLQKKPEPVKEAKLDEDDIIVVPGQGMKRKTGFVPHGQSRVDHEVEMARSDVLATMKNAKAIYELLQNRSEDEGLEGWVQEKLIKANDYLNAVKEYYDEKAMSEMTGGVIAGGGVGEGRFVKGPGGVPLDRHGNPKLPKPVAPKPIAEPKLTLDDVWRKIENVCSQIAPDGDPIDWLAPWLEKHGIKDFKIGEILDRAAKKNGYQDLYDYYDEVKSYADEQGVAEGSIKSPQQQLADAEQKLMDIIRKANGEPPANDAEAKERQALFNKIKRLRTQVAGSRFESVAEGSTGWHPSSTVKNPNFNDELSGRRVSPPGKRLKSGGLDYNERTSQERTKALMKHTQNKGGLSGPKGSLPEGAKVDRMVKHITQSEKKLGHSKKEAENIAWATANKRGMLDNKNKKGK